MSALEDLQLFRATLEPFCRDRALECRVLLAEPAAAMLGAAALPTLFLAQCRDQLVWGRLVEAEQGGKFFIHVRTPFAIAESLKFFRLRSYALILAAPRPLGRVGAERALENPPSTPDLWLWLEEATAVLLAASPPGASFVQFEGIEPMGPPSPRFHALRAVLAVGQLVGTVGTGGVKGDEGMALYVL